MRIKIPGGRTQGKTEKIMCITYEEAIRKVLKKHQGAQSNLSDAAIEMITKDIADEIRAIGDWRKFQTNPYIGPDGRKRSTLI